MKTSYQCPNCASTTVTKNGRANNIQRLHCKDCGKHFRAKYQHQAQRVDLRAKVIRLLENGCSIRACAAKFKISPTTVFNYKKTAAAEYQKLFHQPYSIPRNVIHTVLWSGGKDSSALLIWALEHLPRKDLRIVFCDTGWESPLTYKFIERVNQELLTVN